MFKRNLRNKLSSLALIFLSLVLFSSCGASGSMGNAYNMTKCDYEYRDMADITLAGMNFTNGVSPFYVPKVLAILSGKASSIPLDMTFNIDVTNNNASVASLVGIQYSLSIDGVEFTTGKTNQPLVVNPHSSAILPLTVGVDLATLLSGDSKDAVENIVKNFLGVNSQKSNVKLLIKPTFKVGKYPVSSPVYIPISFSFGGK